MIKKQLVELYVSRSGLEYHTVEGAVECSLMSVIEQVPEVSRHGATSDLVKFLMSDEGEEVYEVLRSLWENEE